jgi:hypothetical protein
MSYCFTRMIVLMELAFNQVELSVLYLNTGEHKIVFKSCNDKMGTMVYNWNPSRYIRSMIMIEE